ncbi:MAG TPA: hypothetical protein VIC34_10990 [Croceibacterium sp.]|jgi:hypothetical protein
MRYLMFGVALAALSTAAIAQSSAWGFFNGANGGMGAGVQAADGAQLLIKCDKPGKHSVFAVVVSPLNLAPPLPINQFESDPVTVRMDDAAPWDDNWRFNDKFAMAVDQGNTRSLERLLGKLQSASTFDIHMRPVGKGEVHTTFSVAGAKEAIDKVFAGCKDDNPLAKG